MGEKIAIVAAARSGLGAAAAKRRAVDGLIGQSLRVYDGIPRAV